MGIIITIASGKGGVGKTTVVANLGVALAKLGKKVLLIDADVAMANLSLILGLQMSPITLHEVLTGESTIDDAIYDGPGNVELIPSGLSLENYKKVDSARLKSIISTLKDKYDYILLDAAAGIEKNVQSALAAADHVLIVTTPDSPSVADALKTKIVAQKLGSKPIGIIINMIKKQKGEIEKKQLMKMMELPSYGEIPYDENVRQTFLEKKQEPVILRNINSPASKSFEKISQKMTGVKIVEKEKKESFLKRLLNKIFKRQGEPQ